MTYTFPTGPMPGHDDHVTTAGRVPSETLVIAVGASWWWTSHVTPTFASAPR